MRQTTVQMVKMNGIGNEIIVVDMRKVSLKLERQTVLTLAKTRETAFDQIMVLYPPKQEGSDCFMEIWNKDGSHAAACGNGTRCVADYLYHCEQKNNFVLETQAGPIRAQILDDGDVSVDMGKPAFDWDKIPTSRPVETTLYVSFDEVDLPDATLVSMGNPHAIFFIETDIWHFKLEEWGPILEHDTLFPLRANISVVRVCGEDALEMRTWERGAGLTRACGSAACAAGVAAVQRGLTKRLVHVRLPGGNLRIEWREDDHVLMQGGAIHEFSALLDLQTGEFERI